MTTVGNEWRGFPGRHPVIVYFVLSLISAACGAFADICTLRVHAQYFPFSDVCLHGAGVSVGMGLLMGGLTSLVGAPVLSSLQEWIATRIRPYILGIATVTGLGCTFVVAFAVSQNCWPPMFS